VALPSAALAANPTRHATYKGQDSKEVELVLKTSSNGKRGRADLYCSKAHVSRIRSFAIRHGRFYGVRKTGSVKIFSIKGHFTSRTTARVTVSLKAACAGGDHHLTLTLAG
jgi:hypothetical protein